MDVAITGSSGLIGTALTASLRTDGHRVLRVVRSNPGKDQLQWDIKNGTIDAAGLEGVDAVVNLSGAGIADRRWNDAYRKELRDSRVEGTKLLATTLAELDKPPSVFVSGSAIGYYGDGGETDLVESSPAASSFMASITVEWEAAAQPAIDAGIPTSFIRTGVVLSKEGGALAKVLPLFKLGLGGKLGSGRQWFSWISIDDQVKAMRHLIDIKATGAFNLTAPQPVRNEEYTKVIGKVLGRPTFAAVPSFGPKLLLGDELANELLFTSAKILPEALTASGYEFIHPDLESALRDVLGKGVDTAI